jgi:hypothetical protein
MEVVPSLNILIVYTPIPRLPSTFDDTLSFSKGNPLKCNIKFGKSLKGIVVR